MKWVVSILFFWGWSSWLKCSWGSWLNRDFCSGDREDGQALFSVTIEACEWGVIEKLGGIVGVDGFGARAYDPARLPVWLVLAGLGGV